MKWIEAEAQGYAVECVCFCLFCLGNVINVPLFFKFGQMDKVERSEFQTNELP